MIRFAFLVWIVRSALWSQTPVLITVKNQTTGMVGIAAGQTARLSVLNPNQGNSSMNNTCSAEVVFLDKDGVRIKSLVDAVQPGKSVTFDLSAGDDLRLTAPGRVQFRVLLSTFSADPAPPPTASLVCNGVIPALELFNTKTGRTSIRIADFIEVQ